jgi:F0F1-type ATP synthase membrane subunit b/b'
MPKPSREQEQSTAASFAALIMLVMLLFLLYDVAAPALNEVIHGW